MLHMNIPIRQHYQQPAAVEARHPVSDEADVRHQMMLLWSRKWFIAAVALSCGVVAAAAAFLAPKKYEATVTLAPVSTSMGGGGLGALGSLASQFGGIAELAGLSGMESGEKAESLAVLESRALTYAYIQQNNLLPVLFTKQWDANRQTWKNARHIPTLWKANRLFENSIRKVVISPKGGLVTLTITWSDPVLAAKWANGLVEMTNADLRDKAIQEADRDIAYLNEQAQKTNMVEIKDAIFSLMKSELNRAMIARGTTEYAFKVLDPAVPPELPSSPRKVLWIVGGTVAGFLLAIFITFVRASWAEIGHAQVPTAGDG